MHNPIADEESHVLVFEKKIDSSHRRQNLCRHQIPRRSAPADLTFPHYIVSEFLDYTRSKSREIADALERVCASRLEFEGDYPLVHSSANHVHLWFLEQQADHAPWIDTEFRSRFIKLVLEHWRIRLKGMAPYRDRGYSMCVYEDAAPTLSVVAETDLGFPYRFGKPVQVERIEDVAALYANRS